MVVAMDSIFLDHFQNPRNAGSLHGAHGSGQAGDENCGALIRMFLKFKGQAIGQATFLASGSSAAIAAGSLLTTLVMGRDWRRAAAIPAALLVETLGRDDHFSSLKGINASAAFAIEALHRALEDSLRRGKFPAAEGAGKKAVLVAMSGGVDSSVACLLQKQAGRDVIGVTMRLLERHSEVKGAEGGCCSTRAILDARETCHRIGLPHLTVDYSGPFLDEVINDFSHNYLAGRTPNPCVRCNGRLRFPALLELASLLGAATVATGHYVRIVRENGRHLLARGADQGKDQSYMLWALMPRFLERLSFPLGEMKKAGVRSLARDARLPAGGRPDSQDICFIPEGDYRRFILSRIEAGQGQEPGPGDIINASGRKIGAHSGYYNYTIGQRSGLGGGAKEPLYVINTVPEKNLVVAGPRRQLAVRSVEISGVNSFARVKNGQMLLLQLRYNSPPVKANVSQGAGIWKADLEEPAYGVAPGQSAVFYEDDVLVAGGLITAATA